MLQRLKGNYKIKICESIKSCYSQAIICKLSSMECLPKVKGLFGTKKQKSYFCLPFLTCCDNTKLKRVHLSEK